MTNILMYLIDTSFCLLIFIAAYKLLISTLTHFSLMRIYLLSSLALSIVLPFIVLPIQWDNPFASGGSFMNSVQLPINQLVGLTGGTNINQSNFKLTPQIIILYSVLIIYLIGFLYKIYLFSKHLGAILGLIKESRKIKESGCWLVDLNRDAPAFSFFNYIFINHAYKNISDEDLRLIKAHEMVHVKQYHTIDLLFIELAGSVFWFNPLMKYLKKSLLEIHEFIADEKTAGQAENKRKYAQLLLSLASNLKGFHLATSFTGEQIRRRLLMMAKPRASSKSKFTFFLLIPLTSFLLVSFSFIKNPGHSSPPNDCNKSPRITQLDLKKYCGFYLPSKRENNIGLKPMEIILKDNKLFADGTVALHFEADSLFSYTDNSARSIKFDLDHNTVVTGCVVVKFETRGHSNYLVLQGEYSKR